VIDDLEHILTPRKLLRVRYIVLSLGGAGNSGGTGLPELKNHITPSLVGLGFHGSGTDPDSDPEPALDPYFDTGKTCLGGGIRTVPVLPVSCNATLTSPD